MSSHQLQHLNRFQLFRPETSLAACFDGFLCFPIFTEQEAAGLRPLRLFFKKQGETLAPAVTVRVSTAQFTAGRLHPPETAWCIWAA